MISVAKPSCSKDIERVKKSKYFSDPPKKARCIEKALQASFFSTSQKNVDNQIFFLLPINITDVFVKLLFAFYLNQWLGPH